MPAALPALRARREEAGGVQAGAGVAGEAEGVYGQRRHAQRELQRPPPALDTSKVLGEQGLFAAARLMDPRGATPRAAEEPPIGKELLGKELLKQGVLRRRPRECAAWALEPSRPSFARGASERALGRGGGGIWGGSKHEVAREARAQRGRGGHKHARWCEEGGEDARCLEGHGQHQPCHEVPAPALPACEDGREGGPAEHGHARFEV
mmetsp:Transcript_51693/g.117741  ORF Transcript_51693/g.117741 Transcript_51693/m.117741 type:complete len:208 (-) Transcript_51693:16-639(-)